MATLPCSLIKKRGRKKEQGTSKAFDTNKRNIYTKAARPHGLVTPTKMYSCEFKSEGHRCPMSNHSRVSYNRPKLIYTSGTYFLTLLKECELT